MFVVGNILNRAHNYFQDFWKRFSILIKAQQLQLNRKNRNKSKKRERGSPPGPYLCWPSHLARPSRLACQSSSTSRQEEAERVAGIRDHTPATSYFRRHLETPRDATRPPRPPLILSHSPPRLPHSLPRWPSAFLAAVRCRRHQSHPFAPPTSPIAPPPLPPLRLTARAP